MRLNDALAEPVLVHAAGLDWVPSPVAGIGRRMLYRVGDEVARATSIVRYAPGSAFPRHVHGGGEEILVLNGVFQDEHGDYPAGSYLRNPPGTSHAPASRDGCTIFVRLWQFRAGDRVGIACRPGEGREVAPRPGAIRATLLFNDGHEEVRIEDWGADETFTVANARGLEFLLLSGTMTMGRERLEPQSWGRLPAGNDLVAVTGPGPVRIWLKDAPLQHPDVLRIP